MKVEKQAGSTWKERMYPVPTLSPRSFRWKASALRSMYRWRRNRRTPPAPIVIVPPLYNRLPAEMVAIGWLNEIDALHSIRQRIMAVSRKTGWDVFTFHTQHNLDRFFDSVITAMRETWSSEGILSRAAVAETHRRFGNILDYALIQPRLLENLVFQSSLMEWTARRAEKASLEFHVVGTALLSATVMFGSLSFDRALDVALKIGSRWDAAVDALAPDPRRRFELMERIIEGTQKVSLGVAADDLIRLEVDAPSRPFWFSAAMNEEPIRIETARDVQLAMGSLNLNSWTPGKLREAGDREGFRGWLISPLHAMAKVCRWSISNYLLATPRCISMFIHDVAAIPDSPVVSEPEVQNRLRLSRMKVTGP